MDLLDVPVTSLHPERFAGVLTRDQFHGPRHLGRHVDLLGRILALDTTA